MLSSDFFRSFDGIFRRNVDVFLKKVYFHTKSHKRTFSAVTVDFGTFSTFTVEFSTVKMGIFGGFVLILFYSYGGNPIFAIKPVYLTCILITSLVIDDMLGLTPPILKLVQDIDMKVKVLRNL
jgi:hypothetical protein